MALIDLARAETKRPGVRCAFGQWFDTLDADMQAEVRDLLAATDVPTSAVARVIAKASGLAFNDDKAARHRPVASRACSDCANTGRIA